LKVIGVREVRREQQLLVNGVTVEFNVNRVDGLSLKNYFECLWGQGAFAFGSTFEQEGVT
jgi:hypothetical protein